MPNWNPSALTQGYAEAFDRASKLIEQCVRQAEAEAEGASWKPKSGLGKLFLRVAKFLG